MAASLDNGIELFANWQTMTVGLTIYVMTAAGRRVFETGFPNATKSKWWYEVALPFGPIANGVLLAVIMKKFPWPPQVAESLSARVTYAIVCGLFCGWTYARVRGLIRPANSGPDNGQSNPIPSLSPAAKPDQEPPPDAPAA